MKSKNKKSNSKAAAPVAAAQPAVIKLSSQAHQRIRALDQSLRDATKALGDLRVMYVEQEAAAFNRLRQARAAVEVGAKEIAEQHGIDVNANVQWSLDLAQGHFQRL
jgi:hypothetical protein